MYDVTIVVEVRRYHRVRVNAETEEEARQVALDHYNEGRNAPTADKVVEFEADSEEEEELGDAEVVWVVQC